MGNKCCPFKPKLRKVTANYSFFLSGKFFPNCLNYVLTLVCFQGFLAQFRLRGSTISRTRTRGSATWLVSRFLVCSCTRSPDWRLSACPPVPMPVGGITVLRGAPRGVLRAARRGEAAAALRAAGGAAAVLAAVTPVAGARPAALQAAGEAVAADFSTITATTARPAVGAAAVDPAAAIMAAAAVDRLAEKCITPRWKAASRLLTLRPILRFRLRLRPLRAMLLLLLAKSPLRSAALTAC